MFRSLRGARRGRVTVRIDGQPLEVRPGSSVAAVLSAAGHERCADAGARPRARHCAMPECFDCFVTIDGIGNRQGCLVEVRDGMRIDTRRGR